MRQVESEAEYAAFDQIGLEDCDDYTQKQLPNGCYHCIGCGKIVSKKSRYINQCSDCADYGWEYP